MSPTVSVNLCCYNSEKYLRETLDSVVNQTYTDWEFIIINDGSSDSTESIISEYIKRGHNIIYHYQENQGLGYSRNEALKFSKGRFIAFIDHDDIWLPEKLEKQIPFFSDPNVGLVYSDAIYFNSEGLNHRLYQSRSYYEGNCFSQLLTDYFLCMQTVMVRRIALESLTYWFDNDFNMIEDADLFARIAYNGWKLAMVNEPLAMWRVHSSSLTWQFPIKIVEEYNVMLQKYGKIIKDFNNRYAREIKTLKYKNAIIKSLQLWKTGKNKDARRALIPFLMQGYEVLFLLGLFFLPESMMRRWLAPFRKTKVMPAEDHKHLAVDPKGWAA
uniref:Glycosyltransferase n=1 Tax=Anaerolinea thermolimosa TaxID=229919 RepID=A0A7C4KJ95_9CHLR